MTPAEYEDLVGEIAGKLARRLGDEAEVQKGRDNRIEGASGFAHQIDVSVQVGGGLHLMECKLWRKKVGVEPVLVLAARVTDIRETCRFGRGKPCVHEGSDRSG